MKVCAIRNKKTFRLFGGRKGAQTIWEKPGWMKSSFFQKYGVKLIDNDEWEQISFDCIEVVKDGV
jgi:hypothetical protein